MSTTSHLWAIGYEDMARAEQVKDEIARLGWDSGQTAKYLVLLDLAVVVRRLDGTFTIEREPFRGAGNILALTGAGFLAGLVVAAPLTGAAIGALVGSAGTAATAHVGIDKKFLRDVEALMKPGTSALFVLDDGGDMEMILHTIRGLGGSVISTNVDAERAKLIQTALAQRNQENAGNSSSPVR